MFLIQFNVTLAVLCCIRGCVSALLCSVLSYAADLGVVLMPCCPRGHIMCVSVCVCVAESAIGLHCSP